MKWVRDDFTVSDDPKLLDTDIIFELLSTTYWASNRTKDVIQMSIASSIPFVLYHQITDNVTGSNYQKGTQVTIVVQTPDKDQAAQYFDALKQGGQVNEPLQKSPAYGNVTDKFGVTFRILTK
ncbi:VOC family protein [Paenibacillus thermotolerans]|uniref:VOC family protein n=1 Tax=Paenibacillus thermotolerans TaxID=3027807 RepID=UPI002368DADE|nr:MULTISPECIES: VOC family protein [unclassified Paenibacillus]